MKHIKFTKEDIEDNKFEITDSYKRLRIEANHPILADLIVEMLNEEFERVALQNPKAKKTCKEIVNEANE